MADQPTPVEVVLLETVRSILLKQDRETLRLLEARLQHIEHQNHTDQEGLRIEIQQMGDRFDDLKVQVDHLDRKTQADILGLVERLTPVLTNLIRRTIYDAPEEMAEAIGPVMSEAIRVQIRDSRGDMVDALSPVIGETVQKAVGEFVREIQRNIDGRLRAALGPQGAMRRISARLRGVSDSELALRGAFPFAIQEIFVIQHGSGLLIAQYHGSGVPLEDSDLLGAMLTAIRDFGREAFAEGSDNQDDSAIELDEISYGSQRIFIQSGRHAYLAVVFNGFEPEGFRLSLQNWVSELHLRYGNALRDYNGDALTLPNLQPLLAQTCRSMVGAQNYAMPAGQRRFLWIFTLALILLVALSCFYLRFTIALLPLAFPPATLTLTPTITPSLTPSLTITSTPSFTPSSTSTPTPSWTPTFTRTPTLSATPTITPSPTRTSTPTITLTSSCTSTPTLSPTPIEAFTSGNVWVHTRPSEYSTRFISLPPNTPVKILGVYGDWYNIMWISSNGIQAGWVYAPFITLRATLPASLFTPTITPVLPGH